MTVKYLHVREIDEYGDLKHFGGLTVAYTLVDTEGVAGICVHLAKCHPSDRFCYKIGRETALKKLQTEGPLEVLPLEHPISQTIIEWLSYIWCPSRSAYCGYEIDIIKDPAGRWISDFQPSQITFIGESLERASM